MPKNTYTDQFKADPVNLYESHLDLGYTKVAQDLGIARGTLKTWVRQDRGLQKTDPRLHRAYMLKDGPRLAFQMGLEEAVRGVVPVGGVSQTATDPVVCKAAAADRNAPGTDFGVDRAWADEREDRVDEFEDTVDCPDNVRVRDPQALISTEMLGLGGHLPVLPSRSVDARTRQTRRI